MAKKTAVKGEIVKRAPRTPKEKAFAKEYIANGGIGYKAALAVYDINSKDPVSTANQIARENLQKLSITEYFDKIEGLRTQDRLMKLVEGLNADKQDQFTGDVRADYNTRYKYLELTFKLDGSLQQTTVNNVQVNIPILGDSTHVPGDDGNQEDPSA